MLFWVVRLNVLQSLCHFESRGSVTIESRHGIEFNVYIHCIVGIISINTHVLDTDLSLVAIVVCLPNAGHVPLIARLIYF